MSQPPQTYELTTFSTIVVLSVSAIFFWLLIKVILNLIYWILNQSSMKSKVKEDIKADDSEDDLTEADGDVEDTDEPADLDTKKGN